MLQVRPITQAAKIKMLGLQNHLGHPGQLHLCFHCNPVNVVRGGQADLFQPVSEPGWWGMKEPLSPHISLPKGIVPMPAWAWFLHTWTAAGLRGTVTQIANCRKNSVQKALGSFYTCVLGKKPRKDTLQLNVLLYLEISGEPGHNTHARAWSHSSATGSWEAVGAPSVIRFPSHKTLSCLFPASQACCEDKHSGRW